MKTRIVVGGVVALGALMVAGLWHAPWPWSADDDGAAVGGGPVPSAVRYRLTYESTEQHQEGLAGTLALEAEVELRAYSAHRVGLVVTRCERVAWRALEQDVMTDVEECAREVAGHEVLLDLDANRALAALDVPPGLTPRAEHLLRGVAQELSFQQRDRRRWSSEERSPRGIARADYEGEGETWVRVRSHYVDGPEGAVAGRTQLVRDGWIPRELHLEEQIEGTASITVRLDLVRTGAVALSSAPAIEGWARWIPGTASETASRGLLEQRVDGYTRDQLLADIAAYADGGQFPEHERTVWRATGLLRLHPELAAALEPSFLDAGATDLRRGLVLDLLASAGTTESQESLRRLLESESATARSDRYAYYVQRLGFVPRPDTETLAWVEARHAAASDFNEKLATAFTLGSVARNAAGIDATAPRRAVAELSAGLAGAPDDRERALWLRAVGATGDASARPLLERGLGGTPSMRLAAVEGLVRLDAQPAIRGAVADAHPAVQALALRHVRLDADGASAIEASVSAGGVHPRNVQSLVRRLAQEAEQHPAEVGRVARALITAGLASGAEASTLSQLAG